MEFLPEILKDLRKQTYPPCARKFSSMTYFYYFIFISIYVLKKLYLVMYD